MDKIIRIECRGSGAMPIDEFVGFQGNLKTLSKEKFDAGRMSILKYGFSAPVGIWKNEHDVFEILDGHQRLFIIDHLVKKEGYTLAGDIPYNEIFAETRKEAAEKLLAVFNSHYGEITEDGLYEYLNENDIDIAAMIGDGLDLPDVDMAVFMDGYIEDSTIENIDINEDKSEEKTNVDQNECPKCGYKWHSLK